MLVLVVPGAVRGGGGGVVTTRGCSSGMWLLGELSEAKPASAVGFARGRGATIRGRASRGGEFAAVAFVCSGDIRAARGAENRVGGADDACCCVRA